MSQQPSIENALNNLAPGAIWVVKYNNTGSKYELEWRSKDVKQPSADEIKEEVKRLASLWESEQYKAARAAEYPPLSDLADALYWADNGKPERLRAYFAACKKVKTKHPKPKPEVQDGEVKHGQDA